MGYLKSIFVVIIVITIFLFGFIYLSQDDESINLRENPCIDSLELVKQNIKEKAYELSDKAIVSKYIDEIEITSENIVTISKNSNSAVCEADFKLNYPFLDKLNDADRARVQKFAVWSMVNDDFTVVKTQSKGRFTYRILKKSDDGNIYIDIQKAKNLSLAMVVTSKVFDSFLNGKI